MTFHQWTALSPTGPLSSTNAPWHRWCCLCQVLWTRTLVGHLAHSHTVWCKQFRVVWRDTRVPLISCKCAGSRVAFAIRLCRTLAMNRSSAWVLAKGCLPFWEISSLSNIYLSIYQYRKKSWLIDWMYWGHPFESQVAPSSYWLGVRIFCLTKKLSRVK